MADKIQVPVRNRHVPRGGARSGVALVMVIWTVAFLAVLVLSFATEAILQSRVNVYIRERTHVDHLTEAGTAIAEVLLLDYSSVSDAADTSTLSTDSTAKDELEEDRWVEEKRAIKRGGVATTGAVPVDALDPDAGTVTVTIKPLEAKWNINNLYPGGDANYDKIWEAILTQANVPQEYWDELVDSWSDWRDTDDAVTGNDGAEEDYYKAKTPPYTARNGEIADIRELAMIKGFADHPALLTGGVINPDAKKADQIVVKSLLSFFDVYGNGKINVNAASDDVLASVPGIDGDAEIIGAIKEGRSSTQESASSGSISSRTTDYGPFKSWSDLTARTSSSVQTEANSYLSYTPESYFEVTIIGAAMGVTHAVRAVAMVKNSKVRYIRWQEDP